MHPKEKRRTPAWYKFLNPAFIIDIPKNLSAYTNVLIYEGVIESCGMVAAFSNYHTFVGSLSFRITDPFLACFGLKLSRRQTV